LEVPGPLPDQIPDGQLAGQSSSRPAAFGFAKFGLDGPGDALGDLILNREDLGQFAIVVFGPDLGSRDRIDEQRRDADAVGRAPHAPLQDVAHAEVPRDLLDVDGAPLEGKAGVAGDDEEPSKFRQRGDDVFGDPVGKVFLLDIAAQVHERQHRDRRLVRQGVMVRSLRRL
jgi:hypothetical protein